MLLAISIASTDAAADRIGSSNLPASTPPLKGRIDDEEKASSVVVLGSSVGATSNAGPTFSETPSAFLDRAFGYAAIHSTALGRVDFNVSLSDRLYPSLDEAYEQSIDAGLSLTRNGDGQQTLIALTVSNGRDIEQRLMESSLMLTHAWTRGTAKPYLRAETALLDYRDVPDPFPPFANQDDRDRVSSRGELGLRLTLTDHVEIQVGAGLDNKHYLERYDDFGVGRDSLSLYPLIGLAYTANAGSLRALYMPLWRTYRDPLFDDTWKHAYAVEGDYALLDDVKFFAAARYGFEETDFLIASSAYESVVLGGVTLTVGKGSISFAASETWRTYDDLDLVAVAREDRKLELAMTGEMPLDEHFSLNSRVSYLDYRSSFGHVGTDALTASLGLTYAATR